jgi:hypothetical protein
MTSVNALLFLRKFPGCDLISFDDMQCCDVIPLTGYNLMHKMRAGVVERAAAPSMMSKGRPIYAKYR